MVPEGRAYLDYNASAPLLPAAREAMLRALEAPGNASSVHREGRARRAEVEAARRSVATLCGSRPERVVFTSGASEAAAMLLTPRYRMGRAPLGIAVLHVAATDHPCLLSGGRFDPDAIVKVGVDGSGLIDPDRLAESLAARGGVPMLACHHANNETGIVQPVAEIARAVRRAGGIFVLDSVQAAGRIPLDIAALDADFIILSSHKIGGPQGAGAIVANSDLLMPEPLIRGGGQERGHRAGTENVAAIAGFGVAARVARERLSESAALAAMRARFEAVLKRHFPDARIVGADCERIANTILFAVPGTKAETLQIAFDLAGVSLSAGSACSSGKVGESHVLAAMGLGGLGGALRVSIGHETGEEELGRFETAAREIAARRRSRAA